MNQPNTSRRAFLGIATLAALAALAAPTASAAAVSGRLITPGGRNTYYVSQGLHKGMILVKVDWPKDEFSTLLIRGRIPYRGTLVRIDYSRHEVARDNRVSFDLDELPYGDYTARLMVMQRETSKLVGLLNVPIRKLPYRANEVCLSEDGWLLASRKPTLPLIASLRNAPKSFDALAAAGFDAAMLPTDQLPSAAAQIRLMPTLTGKPGDAKVAAAIAKANANAALLAWYATKPTAAADFDRFVELCPYHPLVVTVPASKAKAGVAGDIVCVAADAPAKGKSENYAAWADAIAKLTAQGRAAWASVPPAAPATVRMAADLGLANGASGLVIPVDTAAKSWPQLEATAAQLAGHAALCLDASSRTRLTTQPKGLVRAAAIEHAGRTYVFAANPTRQPIKAKIAAPSLEPGRRLWVVGEKRTVSLDADSVIHDAFARFASHVYATKPQP